MPQNKIQVVLATIGKILNVAKNYRTKLAELKNVSCPAGEERLRVRFAWRTDRPLARDFSRDYSPYEGRESHTVNLGASGHRSVKDRDVQGASR